MDRRQLLNDRKGVFYKANFEEAIKTFTYIINEYPSSEHAVESKLWLIRSNVGSGDFEAAESYIEDLNNEKNYPRKIKNYLALSVQITMFKKESMNRLLRSLLRQQTQSNQKEKKLG